MFKRLALLCFIGGCATGPKPEPCPPDCSPPSVAEGAILVLCVDDYRKDIEMCFYEDMLFIHAYQRVNCTTWERTGVFEKEKEAEKLDI